MVPETIVITLIVKVVLEMQGTYCLSGSLITCCAAFETCVGLLRHVNTHTIMSVIML